MYLIKKEENKSITFLLTLQHGLRFWKMGETAGFESKNTQIRYLRAFTIT